MKIATILNAHSYSECCLDTLDSIKTFVGDDVLVVIDGVNIKEWEGKDLGFNKIKGFPHGVNKSPYRNVALGLMKSFEEYPDNDWHLYCEYDVLFTSHRFKKNLEFANEKKIWMLGNDGHVAEQPLPLIQSLIKEKFKSSYYLLGACQFFHKDFMEKLNSINFFEKFLNLTNEFKDGFFPLYSGYDLSEHMYPTLCRHFGGNIGVFAHYDQNKVWHGSYEYFPIRWKPEITEDFEKASIMHPLKNVDNPIRMKNKEKRNLWKKQRQCQSYSTFQDHTEKMEEEILIV